MPTNTTSEEAEVRRLKRRYQQLLTKRDGWRSQWSILSKYILQRPIWFGDTSTPMKTPKLSVAGIYDDECLDAARTSATALGGALWPNTAESFEVCPRQPPQAASNNTAYQTEEVKRYFEQVTKILRNAVDSPESGWQTAWAEYLDDQVVYGTSGIYAEDQDDKLVPFHFKTVSIETAVIDEGPNGMVDSVYFEFNLTVYQVVDKYGIDAVSDRVAEAYKNDKGDEYIKVIQAIEPRRNGQKGDTVDNKPYKSVHFEYASDKLLRNSGMDAQSVFVTRFRKRPNEVYGRSLGMDAIASIKELNVLRKAYSTALLKILDPPIGFDNDQIGGTGTIDLSAGSKVALNKTGRLDTSNPAVEQLLKINEPQQANDRIESLKESIQSKFLVDRLLDFNNKTRMTLGEAAMRGDIRNQALGNVFSRQIVEMLFPLIKHVFNVMWDKKLLGLNPLDKQDAITIAMLKSLGITPLVIPPAIAMMKAQGHAPFEIKFISPAARAMRADAMQGLEKLTNFGLALHNAGVTDAMDVFDAVEGMREYQQVCGAPNKVIRSKEALAAYQAQKAQVMQAQANVAQQEAGANINAKQAKASKDYAQAGLPPTTGMPQQQGAA